MVEAQSRLTPTAILAFTAAVVATTVYFLPSPLLVFVFSVLSYTAVLAYVLRLFGMADYRTLIMIPSGLYAFTGPVWVIIMGHEEGFSADLMARSALCTTVYLLVFALVAGSCAKPESARFHMPARMELLWTAVGGVVALYVMLSLRIALQGGGQSRAEQVSGGSALIGILNYAVFTGIVVLSAALRDDIQHLIVGRRDRDPVKGSATGSRSTRLLPAIIVLAMAGTVILIQVVLAGNRREVLGFMAALFLVINPPRLPLWLIGVAVLTAVFAFYLPWLRESPVSQWLDLLVNFQAYFGTVDISSSEFMPFSMIAEIMFSVKGITDAPTYLDAFGTFIPRAIWANRPEPVGQWFVASYFPEIYEVGGGLAFNAVAESILNFGYAGVVIAPALLAMLLEFINRRLGNLRLGAASILIASMFVMRQDFATTLKGGAIVLATMYLWSFIGGYASAAPD